MSFIGKMKRFSAFVLLAMCGGALSHTYHLGACPVTEPMPGFEMNKVCIFSMTNIMDRDGIHEFFG